MKIIALHGDKRSGKDTAAKVIIATLSDLSFCRIAFADDLKNEVCAALGVTREWLEQNKELCRPILQWWGTEWRRGVFGEDYWLKKVDSKIENSTACVIIVTDLRFKNEYQCLDEWVEPTGSAESLTTIDIIRHMDGQKHTAHASERDLDDHQFDFTLTNNSTVAQFQIDVARFTNRVLTQRLGLAIRGEP